MTTLRRCEKQLESLHKCGFSDLQSDLQIQWVCGGGQELAFLRNIPVALLPLPQVNGYRCLNFKLWEIVNSKLASLLELLFFPLIVWGFLVNSVSLYLTEKCLGNI